MIDIYNKTSSKNWRKYDDDFYCSFDDTIKLLNIDNYHVSLILVKDPYMKQTNNLYRNKNYPTDVLTFDNPNYQKDKYLGDIFINVDACSRQAKEYGHTIRREINFLFIHGLLHCLGYDHQNIKQEKQMFDLQHQLIKDKGYLNE